MKPYLNTHTPDEPNEMAEALDNLKHYIDPIKALGFTFEKYGVVCDDEDGVTVLVFKSVREASILEDEDDYKAMVEICTQDDDDQPNSTYRFFMGTLWVFIPFVA